MICVDDNIHLRPISTQDSDFILSMRNSLAISNEFFSDPPLYDFAHLAWIQKFAKNNIELIIEYQSFKAGQIRLTDIDYRHQKAQFGIFLSNQYQNKGIGFKASNAFLDYVFHSLPINKIYLDLFLKNNSALRLYEKLGFEKEGLLKEEFYKNGVFQDVIRMALFKKNWNK